ncbi:MAG TPA: 50S ribosomal protein L11 methyltransferase [Chthoniobacterales bacterium]|jgi:ribosomal protein L11 methyltransferase|nr:50S ribosomal protein L11 methyltransferase [Chthoniobacterales bacterium]
MYLWQRSATQKWLSKNEAKLRAIAGDQVAIIERPNRKHLQVEVASESRAQLERIAKQLGGRIEKLSRDWLKRLLRQKTKPIRFGNKRLTIPAGAAFGTGEHATTAMSLRLLEKLARDLNRGWFMVDLGTGSGILALAAKVLGAKRAVGIDNDPIATSTAKQNAQLNKIRGVQFRVADVRRWKSTSKIDIVTANLYSELLIEILRNLKAARWLILSGFLRIQERDVRRALTRNKLKIIEVRKRGKWVAILAGRR